MYGNRLSGSVERRKYTIVMIVDTILERKKKGCCELVSQQPF